MPQEFPEPHGGRLIDRLLKEAERERALKEHKELPKLMAREELLRDMENIAEGVFSPLRSFMVREDYLSVLYRKRLASDLAWTIPIVFDASSEEVKGLKEGDRVAITTHGGRAIALMELEEVYPFDRKELAMQVYGTLDLQHPGVENVRAMEEFLVGGKIDLVDRLESPFAWYRLSPAQTRALFKSKGWESVVGFQTRNVPHLGHEYLQKTALTLFDGLFINPLIGRKKEGDFKDEVILGAYEALIENYYPKERVVISVLQTEMRYAGPREAVHHAIIRKNFGCTHFMIGRDHAGVGSYYPPYAAQEIFEEFPDLGINPLFFPAFFYCRRCRAVSNEKTCPHSSEERTEFSGTRLRDALLSGERPSTEMVRPEVSEAIMKYKDPFVGPTGPRTA